MANHVKPQTSFAFSLALPLTSTHLLGWRLFDVSVALQLLQSHRQLKRVPPQMLFLKHAGLHQIEALGVLTPIKIWVILASNPRDTQAFGVIYFEAKVPQN